MNKLLRHIFLLLIILSTGYGVSSAQNLRRSGTPATTNKQPKDTKAGKKLMAARNRFLSQQLSLTDDEARRFWPVYNQYQQELTAVRILKRLNNSSAQANGTEQIDKEIYYDNQLVNIRKHYRDLFLKILPPEK